MAEEESFRITDRRGRSQEAAPVEPAAETPPGGSPSPTPGTSRESPGPAEASRGEPDLQGLFVMFASSALIALGEAPDPMTGERRVDLEQAQEAIETLLLLRAKTEGNRNEAESRLLEEMLYDLELRFVRAAQGSARPS